MTAALSWVPGAHVDICASRGFNVIQFCIWQLVLWDVLRFLHPDLLGVLRTLGFYINFRQLAINGHPCCVLAHAFSPQRAEARLGEEMFINGYALITWKWALTTFQRLQVPSSPFPSHLTPYDVR